MPKKQIKYNDANNVLRLEFPPEWDINSITGVTCTVKDVDGNTLESASAATIYTADTLAAAASSGDNTITLTTGNALVEGDRIRIEGGTRDDRNVLSYVVSTKVVTLDTVIDYDHASSASVYGMFATYTLDTTTVATWPKNKQLNIIWQPDIAVAPYTELAEIAEVGEFSASDFDAEFAALYPREYENARERLSALKVIAEDRLKDRLYTRGMNMERVKDQRAIMPVLLSLTRWLTIQGYGDDWEFEIGQAWDNYLRDFEDLCALPIWVDDNQDDIQTEDEFYVFEPMMFGRNM